MAHLEQKVYFIKIKSMFPDSFNNTSVVEIGSLNINGTVRDLFTNSKRYVGIDLENGPGVDVVCEGQKFYEPDNTFDTSISSECFEHNPYWEETFVNMHRITKPGGLVTFTCASNGRGEHGTSRSAPECSPFTINAGWEYYKNLNEKDFEKVMKEISFSEYLFEYNKVSHDLYFYGIKA